MLDSAPEENFERLTRLASRNLQAPIAVLSLADDHRQFFKSARGLPEPTASVREMPLANSLCEHVVGSGAPVVISDARQHPQGHASREVRDLRVVAYLGVPLITPDRHSLGSFWVADFEARDWRTDDIETLRDLAATAVCEIALRKATMKLQHSAADDCQRDTIVRVTTEERLRLVLSAVRAGLWEWDLLSGRQVWSPGIYHLFGCDEAAGPLSPPEFLNRLVHPDDRPLLKSIYRNLVEGRERARFLDVEYRIIRPDGETVWVGSIGYVQQDEWGRPTRVLGVERDISARKRAEQAQQESAQFIREMTAVTADFIYVFEPAEQRTVYTNRPLSEMLGYGSTATEQDVSAWSYALIHPDDRERADAFRHSLQEFENHAVAELDCRYRRADGTWGWILWRHTVFARNADRSVRQVVGTITEITAVKRAEEELRRLNAELEQRVAARTAELSRVNRELESFAYSVSHDLRAPLRAIDGFSRMLLDHYGEQLDAKGKHYLDRVHEAGRRMGELIDALLALSRATRGQLSLERVNMSALASSITTDLARSEADRAVDVVIADDVTATGDPVLLRIALENLLGNAWKFTSRNEQARIEFGARSGQRGPTFFVRDNGVGFDMEQAARLFAPFRRLHTAEEFPGTGIGLATVHRIIARHGGRIWAESAPGAGTTFYFTLSGAGGS